MTSGEVVTLLAYGVGATVFYLAAREKGQATVGMGRLALVGVVFGVLGARLTEFVAAGGSMSSLLNPTMGGRALVGGLIFGWAAVEVAKVRMGIRSSTGGYFALALPAGEAVGRIGCYLNGCCFGTESDVPWTVWQHGAYRHPAQLYSATAALALFGWLCAVRHRYDGKSLFRFYLLGWGASRFLLEYVREGSRPIAGLTAMQLLSAEIVVVAAITMWLAMRTPAPAKEGA